MKSFTSQVEGRGSWRGLAELQGGAPLAAAAEVLGAAAALSDFRSGGRRTSRSVPYLRPAVQL